MYTLTSDLHLISIIILRMTSTVNSMAVMSCAHNTNNAKIILTFTYNIIFTVTLHSIDTNIRNKVLTLTLETDY